MEIEVVAKNKLFEWYVQFLEITRKIIWANVIEAHVTRNSNE